MNNEIGRKITSLTLMTIMFAGGMAIGVPSFMPEAASDFSKTDGMLTVSSEFIQGAAVLEIVVNDPGASDVDNDISSGPEITLQGVDYDMNQGTNGKWYLYIVDASTASDVDDDQNGMEFGFLCTTGLGTSATSLIIPSGTNVYAEILTTSGTTSGEAGGCLDADNMIGTLDDTNPNARERLSDAILQSAPTLSDHNDGNSDLGQQGHSLNASGFGTWPYILPIDLNSDNIIEYGSDAVNVEYGNTDDETSIGLINDLAAANTQIHLWISDPALNIDPTDQDAWTFDLNQSSTVIFANNGTNNTISTAEQGAMQCGDNCLLTVDDASTAPGQLKGYDAVTMIESGANTAYFESWDENGNSAIYTVDQAVGDKQHTFKYGGDSADLVIAYNDGSISLEAPSDPWIATQVATVTLNDPDANTNPGDEDDLSVGNSTHIIPTIKMGSPLTLAGGGNTNLQTADSNVAKGTIATNVHGVTVGSGSPAGHAQGETSFSLNLQNTTDHSERLRIIHSASAGNTAIATSTWINVTTGHTRSDLVDLPGTVVLNYDVSGPAGLLSATAVEVYITDDGDNATDHTNGLITCYNSGNAAAGVCDLDDDSEELVSRDISAPTWTGSTHEGTNFVSVAFKLTHAASDGFRSDADYAIAADFCNFDQNNGSDVHNCIYRIEAEETGENTGVFTGSVDYITLVNATTGGTVSGEKDGNDHEVDGMLDTVGEDVTIVLNNDVDGSSAIRVVYNDTDALQTAEKLGAQLDTVTHTATVDLDADTYEADDMATITVVDADLNQDSDVRDVYQNSTTTFQMTITGSDEVAHKPFATSPISIIETTPDSGIFVGTFVVPDYNGQDMEVTYYEARNAGGNAVEIYDIATISSNSGTVAFEKSVYPVPFTANDLSTGDATTTVSTQSEAGNVTLTVTVADSDFTGDQLTTSAANTAGTIEIILVEGTTSSTCFTAGSASAQSTQHKTTSTVQELGPLDEVGFDSSEFEVEFTIDEVQDCGANMRTVSSGDVIQVKYVDTSDDSGSTSTVYDSSTFDLRTGSLSVDKDVYVLGSDLVVTLTDPDLNLDSGTTEEYNMSIIEWDSDADSSELLNQSDFTNNPSKLQETGDDTGVFQTVTTLPTATINSVSIDYGEAVTLTYVDVGLSGEDNIGDDTLDVEAYFSISNFGALIELDQAVYSWTDVVYFTITAPDHNVNSASEEQIGTSALPIQLTTRSGKLCSTGDKTYKADESGPDTGIFEGEVELTGFAHTMSSDSTARTATSTSCGSTNDGGSLTTASQTDGISVSYEYNDGVVVVASASIVWAIGEASFDSSAVSAGGSSTLTVVDQDENLDDDIIDTFTVDVFSDSDAGGFQLTMNETDEDTGVFEGTVFFTADLATSGSNLRVSEGDTVTAEYTDETLPEPYTTDDDLTIAATTTVGTAFPPLERAPAANARVVDAFGSSIAEVSVDQQVQIAADVSNGQSKDQAFAYLVQVQDSNGVTVSLAWITGSLTGGQSMSPALSWTPDASGSYTATVFVWESVDNPTALSPTVSVEIDVV